RRPRERVAGTGVPTGVPVRWIAVVDRAVAAVLAAELVQRDVLLADVDGRALAVRDVGETSVRGPRLDGVGQGGARVGPVAENDAPVRTDGVVIAGHVVAVTACVVPQCAEPLRAIAFGRRRRQRRPGPGVGCLPLRADAVRRGRSTTGAVVPLHLRLADICR